MIVLELIYGICYEFVVVMNMMDKLFVDVVSSDFFLDHVNFCIISLFFVNYNYVFVCLLRI
jgi:hypothetical protein